MIGFVVVFLSQKIHIQKQIINYHLQQYCNNFNMNFRGTAYPNKHIKKWEEQRKQDYLVTNIRKMRPVTCNLNSMEAVPINNKKRQMQNEDRFTQIQRANRILLEKITGIMNKRSVHSTGGSKYNNKVNKSLNSSLRKRQLQNIQIENAKLLKRLQQKRPTYETEKLHKDWRWQKGVIKNLANFPFIIPDKRKVYRRSSYHHEKTDKRINGNIQLCRMRVIDGTNFLITVKLDKEKLQIVGDTKNKRQIKVIEISREEALQFIQTQCNNKIQDIFKKLHYDKEEQVLYLVGENEDDIQDNPEGQQLQQQQPAKQSNWVPRVKENNQQQQQSQDIKQPPKQLNTNKPLQSLDHQLQKPQIEQENRKSSIEEYNKSNSIEQQANQRQKNNFSQFKEEEVQDH